MLKLSLLLFLLFGLSCSCFGQERYLIFIKNRYRYAIYRIGDELSFKLKGDKSKITAQIENLEDTLIVFDGLTVNPRNISSIYVDDKTRDWYFLKYKYEKLFLISGIGFFLIDAANTGNFNRKTSIISGSLVAASFLARWGIGKSIKIRGRRKLAIIR